MYTSGTTGDPKGVMISNNSIVTLIAGVKRLLESVNESHDAAYRVIARLKKERNEARGLLAQAERKNPISIATAAAAVGTKEVNATALSNGKRAAEDDEIGPDGKRIRPGISSSIISELTECNAALSQQRKKRQIPPTLAPVDAVERYTQLSSYPLHKTNKPGILSLDVHYSKLSLGQSISGSIGG